ncbi:MAG: ABC transporter permease [SAR324 cluster bacterium]|nr:ABC transporter permease [SAR324 cluster bacterium]
MPGQADHPEPPDLPSPKTEADRQIRKNKFAALFQHPEIGPLGVMLLLLLALGFFSIPESADTLNPFKGEGLNALGIRNNTRLIAQLGIIAIGAGMLIISGEFDLSIGSMVGFSGMCMAIILKWGFHISVPILSSTPEGLGLDWIRIFSIDHADPWMALGITLCFTLFFGWLIGFIVVKTGMASFIVSLSFLFFLRGLTEVCYRAFNKAPDQTSGSTQVSGLPDIKNIVELPGYGEIERSKIAVLPKAEIQKIYNSLSPEEISSFSEKISYSNFMMAENKTQMVHQKTLESLGRDIEHAQQSGNTQLLETLQTRLAEHANPIPVPPAPVRELDVVKEYVETLPSLNPVADFLGGNIFQGLFDWFYEIGWNINNYGRQFAPGLYSSVLIWVIIALVAYVVLSKTQAGNWIYSTGGDLNAAKANGVPTGKVKISLFVFSAFCATMFAATQVFETNTSDAAKGNLKELEAIAAAVIGGVVLTGGFGTIAGIVLGAVIFGIAREAFFYIPFVDGSFYRVFLGFVLLTAALTNENIRKRITGGI